MHPMTPEQFRGLVAEVLDTLPERFRMLLDNVAIIVEDAPERNSTLAPKTTRDEALLMGEFIGVPRTKKSVWDFAEPNRVVLYQKNIEAFCTTEGEIREQVRLTVLHELGHYFGMDEDQLHDV
jgi:predicted Zn-dependent protease with MMP-like domain